MKTQTDIDSVFENLRERDWDQPSHKARLARDLLGAPPVGSRRSSRRPLMTLGVVGAGVAGVAFAGVGVYEFMRPEPVATAPAPLDPPAREVAHAGVTPDGTGIERGAVAPADVRAAAGEVASGDSGSADAVVSGARVVQPGAVLSAPSTRAAAIAAADVFVTDWSFDHDVTMSIEAASVIEMRVDPVLISASTIQVMSTCRRGDLARLHPEVIVLRGDLDGDGALGPMDIVRFTEGYVLGEIDLDGDGATTVFDYVRFTESYLNAETDLRREGWPRVVSVEASPHGPAEDLIRLEDQASVQWSNTVRMGHDGESGNVWLYPADPSAHEQLDIDVLLSEAGRVLDASSGTMSQEVLLRVETVLNEAAEAARETP